MDNLEICCMSVVQMADAVKKSLSSLEEGSLNNEYPEWICYI